MEDPKYFEKDKKWKRYYPKIFSIIKVLK